MDDEERYGVLVALRELNGWTYLGGGKWEEPKHFAALRKMQREAESRANTAVR